MLGMLMQELLMEKYWFLSLPLIKLLDMISLSANCWVKSKHSYFMIWRNKKRNLKLIDYLKLDPWKEALVYIDMMESLKSSIQLQSSSLLTLNTNRSFIILRSYSNMIKASQANQIFNYQMLRYLMEIYF
jgi:hypothetical protein